MTGQVLGCTLGLRQKQLPSQGQRGRTDRQEGEPLTVPSAARKVGHMDMLCDTNMSPEEPGTHMERKFY